MIVKDALQIQLHRVDISMACSDVASPAVHACQARQGLVNKDSTVLGLFRSPPERSLLEVISVAWSDLYTLSESTLHITPAQPITVVSQHEPSLARMSDKPLARVNRGALASSRPLSAITGGMARDVLAKAHSQALGDRRFRIGPYLLREPVYRQVLVWAEELKTTPDGFVEKRVKEVIDGHITELDFSRTSVNPLDRQHVPLLTKLDCSGSRLIGRRGYIGIKSLDLQHVPLLTKLSCSRTNIQSLDLQHVPLLTELDCSCTKFWPLGLQHVPLLTELSCSNTLFESLDLQHVPLLTELSCSETSIESLDLQHVPLLTELYCWCTSIESLDLQHVPLLTTLVCLDTSIESLDLQHVPLLTKLDCLDTSIESLDLQHVPLLTKLNCNRQTQILNKEKLPDLEISHLELL